MEISNCHIEVLFIPNLGLTEVLYFSMNLYLFNSHRNIQNNQHQADDIIRNNGRCQGVTPSVIPKLAVVPLGKKHQIFNAPDFASEKEKFDTVFAVKTFKPLRAIGIIYQSVQLRCHYKS